MLFKLFKLWNVLNSRNYKSECFNNEKNAATFLPDLFIGGFEFQEPGKLVSIHDFTYQVFA